MPSTTHQRLEYALLLSLGGLLLLDRVAPPALRLLLASTPVQVVTLVLLGVLLRWHHWRKELLPAYVAAALRVASLVGALVASSPTDTTAPTANAYVWIDRMAVASVMLAALLAAVFPLPDLSKLYGKYRTIGCRTARFNGVECRVFYPSATHAVPVAATQRVQYLHHGHHLAHGIYEFSRVPTWFFTNLENAFLAAVDQAPVATPERDAGFPLVLFSHGLGGSLELYSFLNQQLASEGYVVVVLSHGDGSASVTKPTDDRIEYYQQITDAVRHNVDGEGFRFRNAQLRVRVQEMRRVLDAVTALATAAKEKAIEKAKPDALWARVDLSRVHAVGHSFGAATALTATHDDDRLGAPVLLDAWMEPVDTHVRMGHGDRVPVLHLGSDPFAVWKENADRIQQHARGCPHEQTRVDRIAGTRHNNFSDLPLFSPWINRLVKSAGRIDPTYALRMIAQLSAAFLVDQYDQAATEFPEVVPMDADMEVNKKAQ